MNKNDSFALSFAPIRQIRNSSSILANETMFISRFLLLALTVFRTGDALVSCAECPTITINVATDAEIPTDSCSIKPEELCQLLLRIDYTESEKNFALMYGANESVLLLSNGDPQVIETTSIWFNEVRVQRMATINCFVGSSCGLDRLKTIYRDECAFSSEEEEERNDIFHFSSNVRLRPDSTAVGRDFVFAIGRRSGSDVRGRERRIGRVSQRILSNVVRWKWIGVLFVVREERKRRRSSRSARLENVRFRFSRRSNLRHFHL